MKAEFQEYDVVCAKNLLPLVPIGTRGTVLIVYPGGEDYEVEFFNEIGETLNVLTVSHHDLAIWPLHVELP
ncbi:DUF4926 domain-containing protein [Leptospira alexanderi]|uniref:DUF4926 domain-containing protein n=1 Tax=Leptospira alexanderi TaxID=100053 RepID=UPI0009910D75|nr:DUF4926 domain-containing protein [Leptospira alexanderi]